MTSAPNVRGPEAYMGLKEGFLGGNILGGEIGGEGRRV